MLPIISEPYENACPASPLIKETALLKPVEMVVVIPEIVVEIPDFIELKALVAAVLIPLLRFVTVVFMAFQPEEITVWMPSTTPPILLLIADQMEETTVWMAESTVEITVLMAVHAVVIRVWIPVRSGDRNDTMAFHTVVTAV